MKRSFRGYSRLRETSKLDSKFTCLCEGVVLSGLSFPEFWANVGMPTFLEVSYSNTEEFLDLLAERLLKYIGADALHNPLTEGNVWNRMGKALDIIREAETTVPGKSTRVGGETRVPGSSTRVGGETRFGGKGKKGDDSGDFFDKLSRGEAEIEGPKDSDDEDDGGNDNFAGLGGRRGKVEPDTYGHPRSGKDFEDSLGRRGPDKEEDGGNDNFAGFSKRGGASKPQSGAESFLDKLSRGEAEIDGPQDPRDREDDGGNDNFAGLGGRRGKVEPDTFGLPRSGKDFEASLGRRGPDKEEDGGNDNFAGFSKRGGASKPQSSAESFLDRLSRGEAEIDGPQDPRDREDDGGNDNFAGLGGRRGKVEPDTYGHPRSGKDFEDSLGRRPADKEEDGGNDNFAGFSRRGGASKPQSGAESFLDKLSRGEAEIDGPQDPRDREDDGGNDNFAGLGGRRGKVSPDTYGHPRSGKDFEDSLGRRPADKEEDGGNPLFAGLDGKRGGASKPQSSGSKPQSGAESFLDKLSRGEAEIDGPQDPRDKPEDGGNPLFAGLDGKRGGTSKPAAPTGAKAKGTYGLPKTGDEFVDSLSRQVGKTPTGGNSGGFDWGSLVGGKGEDAPKTQAGGASGKPQGAAPQGDSFFDKLSRGDAQIPDAEPQQPDEGNPLFAGLGKQPRGASKPQTQAPATAPTGGAKAKGTYGLPKTGDEFVDSLSRQVGGSTPAGNSGGFDWSSLVGDKGQAGAKPQQAAAAKVQGAAPQGDSFFDKLSRGDAQIPDAEPKQPDEGNPLFAGMDKPIGRQAAKQQGPGALRRFASGLGGMFSRGNKSGTGAGTVSPSAPAARAKAAAATNGAQPAGKASGGTYGLPRNGDEFVDSLTRMATPGGNKAPAGNSGGFDWSSIHDGPDTGARFSFNQPKGKAPAGRPATPAPAAAGGGGGGTRRPTTAAPAGGAGGRAPRPNAAAAQKRPSIWQRFLGGFRNAFNSGGGAGGGYNGGGYGYNGGGYGYNGGGGGYYNPFAQNGFGDPAAQAAAATAATAQAAPAPAAAATPAAAPTANATTNTGAAPTAAAGANPAAARTGGPTPMSGDGLVKSQAAVQQIKTELSNAMQRIIQNMKTNRDSYGFQVAQSVSTHLDSLLDRIGKAQINSTGKEFDANAAFGPSKNAPGGSTPQEIAARWAAVGGKPGAKGAAQPAPGAAATPAAGSTGASATTPGSGAAALAQGQNNALATTNGQGASGQGAAALGQGQNNALVKANGQGAAAQGALSGRPEVKVLGVTANKPGLGAAPQGALGAGQQAALPQGKQPLAIDAPWSTPQPIKDLADKKGMSPPRLQAVIKQAQSGNTEARAWLRGQKIDWQALAGGDIAPAEKVQNPRKDEVPNRDGVIKMPKPKPNQKPKPDAGTGTSGMKKKQDKK